jgi:hypothetical protein
MRPEELIIQRRNTTQFISTESTTVRFQRTISEPNRRGGISRSNQFYTEPQVVRFVDARPRQNRSGFTGTSAGRIETDYNRIIAEPDADVMSNDTFVHRDRVWRVTKVIPRPFELVAECEEVGDGSSTR